MLLHVAQFLLCMAGPKLPDASMIRGNTGGPTGPIAATRLTPAPVSPCTSTVSRMQRRRYATSPPFNVGSSVAKVRSEQQLALAAQKQLLETATLDNQDETAGEAAAEALWPWQLAMISITACWGANFAVTSWSLDALGGGSTDGELFVASRFVVGASALLPFLASASSVGAVWAGAQVGLLCACGYATQAVALSLGTQAGTAAFICSLQSVVVALMAARSSGVAIQTWIAVALSVCGVGCLELPSVLAGGGSAFCIGDLVAFGQPLGFGLSYVLLESVMEEYPEDELPIAALQCAVIAAAAVTAASLDASTLPWSLPWGHLLTATAGDAPAWGVPSAILYTGLISTSLTIWLTARVFSRLPSTDASIILASEPLWATAVAVGLLGAQVGASDALGGALIISGLACNQGLLDGVLPVFAEAEAEAEAEREEGVGREVAAPVAVEE